MKNTGAITNELLQPLINLMDERLRGSGYIRINETPVQVLKSEKAATSKHWMRVRVAGPPGQRLILFDHDASRASSVAERLLKDAHGYVQSDGYAAYDAVAVQLNLTHVGTRCACAPSLLRSDPGAAALRAQA